MSIASMSAIPFVGGNSRRISALVLRLVLSGIFLFAPLLKMQAYLRGDTADLDFFGLSIPVIALVGVELVFGLWWASGLSLQFARWPTLFLFVAFSAIAVHKGIRGDASCGCFGTAELNPWIVASIDIGIVIALSRIQFDAVREMAKTRIAQLARCGLLPAVFIAIGSYWMWKNAPNSFFLGRRELSETADNSLLSPQSWNGTPLPILPFIDINETLGSGHWAIALYRKNCGHCQEVIPHLRRLESALAARPIGPQLALVEVPSGGKSIAGASDPDWAGIYGRLDGQRQWFIKTPAVILVNNGRVVRSFLETDDVLWLSSDLVESVFR